MSLTFLTPLLLAGAALTAVPILIHLIMRQKPKHLLFPAFRFLLQKHRTTVQKLRLRHILLLAMRILLILLICGALARPELSGGPNALGNDAPVAVLLVFDTTPSMEYVHEGKSRLEAAKEQAVQFLESVSSGSRVAVFDTAEPGGQFVSVSDGIKQVQNRRIQAYNRPVTVSVEDVYRLLTRETPELPLLLCVFSDRTAASWNAEAVGAVLRPAKQRLAARLPEGLPAFYVDLGVKEPRNIALTGLSLRQGGTPTPLEGLLYGGLADELIQLQATVQVTGAAVDSELLLTLDGQLVDRKRLQVAATPGQVVTQTVPFIPLPRTGKVHQGEVRLKSSDALESDNSRFWTLTTTERKALIIADRPSDALEWQLALESSPMPLTCTVIAPKDLPGNLHPDQFQAVCLLNVARPADELWETLRRYLSAGGGVIVLPGEDCEVEAYNHDIALGVLPGRLTEKVDVPEPFATLAPPNYEHPILQPFKRWEKESLPGRVYRYWKVSSDGDLARTVLPMNYTEKGALKSVPVILERVLDRQKVQGRALLYTTAMHRRIDRKDWNTFQQEGNWLALALPYSSIRYVLGAREERQNFQLGDDVRFWLPRTAGLTTYELDGPQRGNGEIKEGDTQLAVREARRPGNYSLSAGPSWSRHFSMNLSPDETNLTAGGPSPSEIEELFGPESLRLPDDGFDLREVALARLGHAPKTELLPLLMIGLLLFLALENLLANRFYRKQDGAEAGPNRVS
jgi:hypothetical protein